ncbi:S1C family serine protease [Bacillus sp. V5-8f]|uniref:S1C family serine protease n=1 Tax=Bacillus sp. V5-8f TaxID=2053044 RepID=UPI000C78DAF9|nr:trypsin-like peptidase domain-containing protein [Bacillus sp. V5-8f]PLT34538.1 peptidase S1 [Bacillus sp. V5-8f]
MNLYENELNQKLAKKKKRVSRLMLPLSGVVLGSVMTLYVTNNFDFENIPSVEKLTENFRASAVEKKDNTKAEIAVQQTSTHSDNLVEAIEKVSEAVVGVINIQQQNHPFSAYSQTQENSEAQSGTGSGVVFKKVGNNAYIVTNNHVIDGADKVEISLSSGKRVQAEIVGADPLTDLAVLKIDGANVNGIAQFGDSSKLRLGEQVAAIGNPLGLDFAGSVTQGIISGKERTIPVTTSEGEWDASVIQTDAAINPGNSGGALINSSGQVVGINSLKIAEDGVEGLGFAIPSQDVVPIINELLQSGKVKRPYLGITLENVTDLSRYVTQQQLNLPIGLEEGVVVSSVEPSSSAAKAGMKSGDVIVSVDGKEVDTVGQFRQYLYLNAKEANKIRVKIYRNGKEMSVTINI